MRTVEVTLFISRPKRELMIAELLELGFDAFEERDICLRAYAPLEVWSDDARRGVADLLDRCDAEPRFEERVIEPQNWNEIWERSTLCRSAVSIWLSPTSIGPRC